MALDENSGVVATMPVAPAYNAGYGGNGGFGFGGDWAWILLLLLIGGNGWGMGGFGGGMMWPMMMGGFGGGFGLDYLYPWLNNSEHISGGFRDQQLNSAVQGIQSAVTSGFGDVQLGIAGVNQNICQTGNGITAAVNNGFSAAEAAANARQIANMQQAFSAQTAQAQGFNGLQSQLSQCCCDNRLASADLKYTIATENCADRAALSDGIRDVLAATQTQTQAILDKLCAQELEAERRENANLRSQLNMAQIESAKNAQTAAIEASQAAQTQYIINRVAPYPIPSYNVGNPYSGNCCNGSSF